MQSFNHPRARTSRDLILLRLPLTHRQGCHTAAAGQQPWGRRAALLPTPAATPRLSSGPVLPRPAPSECWRSGATAPGSTGARGPGGKREKRNPRRGTARPSRRAGLGAAARRETLQRTAGGDGERKRLGAERYPASGRRQRTWAALGPSRWGPPRSPAGGAVA